MAKIFGELEKAQIENLVADPTGTGLVLGRMWYNTTDDILRVYDGTAVQEFVDLDKAQTLQNKVLDGPVLNGPNVSDYIEMDHATTPTNPAAGKMRTYFKNDGLLYRLDETGDEELVGGTGSGGGGINYIINGDFESDIDEWIVYDDGAVAVPVDGTGGVPASSVTHNTGTPLRGAGSLNWNDNGSIIQGEGVSTDFSVDDVDKNRALNVSFDYSETLTTGMQVYVYDIDNLTLIGAVINDDDGYLKNVGVGEYATFTGRFYGTGSSNYRLIIHRTDTVIVSASASFDNVRVSPDALVPGAIITDPQEYNLVIGATTTAPSGLTYSVNKAVWWREGAYMNIQYTMEISGGTAGTGTYLFPIPSGYTIDSSLIDVNADYDRGNCGSTSVHNGSKGSVVTYDTTNLQLTAGNSGSDYLPVASTTYALTVFRQISFTAKVPIVGWSAGAIQSTTENLFSTARARYTSAAGQSVPNNTNTIIDFDTKDFDSLNTVSGTGSAWAFTAPKSGVYRVSSQVRFTSAPWTGGGAEFMLMELLKNGSRHSYLDVWQADVSITQLVQSINGTDLVTLSKGDTVAIRVIQNSGGGVTLGSGSDMNYFNIEEVPDFSTFSVFGETEYLESKGQPGTNFPITANTMGDLTSLPVGVGEWELDAQYSIVTDGAWTTGRIEVGISENSGTSTVGLVVADNYIKDFTGPSGGAGFYRSIMVTRYKVINTSPTTFYLKAKMVNTANTNLDGYKLSARKIK